jgi:hypothetical protein
MALVLAPAWRRQCFAVELGSAMATLERDGAPWLTIDAAATASRHTSALRRRRARVFMTHAHTGPRRRLRAPVRRAYWSRPARPHAAVRAGAAGAAAAAARGRYPNALAEGGANFWDAFHLVPVGDHFWHDGVRWKVFATRHHWPDTSFGLRLRGSVVWTGDTRPIPESSRSTPMPASWSSTTARCTAIPRTAASTISNANTRADCSRAACSTTTRAQGTRARLANARGHRIGASGRRSSLATPGDLAPMP